MTQYPTAYLEAVLNVEKTRELIAKAHAVRMAIPDRDARLSAKLSDFLPIEDFTKAWFIHDRAEIPVCRGWPREPIPVFSHHVESRTCINDSMCTAWQPLPEVASCTAGALCDYLRELQGREPVLHVTGFGQRMVEDADGVQYRFVSMPPLRIPEPQEIELLFSLAGVA